jgi:hypothetical protein
VQYAFFRSLKGFNNLTPGATPGVKTTIILRPEGAEHQPAQNILFHNEWFKTKSTNSLLMIHNPIPDKIPGMSTGQQHFDICLK